MIDNISHTNDLLHFPWWKSKLERKFDMSVLDMYMSPNVHFWPTITCYWFCLDAYIPIRWTMFKLNGGKKMIFQFLLRCSATIDKILCKYFVIVSEIVVNIWEGWDLFFPGNHNIYIYQQQPVTFQGSLLAFNTYDLNKLRKSWHFHWLIFVFVPKKQLFFI